MEFMIENKKNTYFSTSNETILNIWIAKTLLILTKMTLKKVIEQSEKKLIIVDFWAPWCGPCKQLTPIMEKVAREYVDEFELVKINIDENNEIASQLKFSQYPPSCV